MLPCSKLRNLRYVRLGCLTMFWNSPIFICTPAMEGRFQNPIFFCFSASLKFAFKSFKILSAALKNILTGAVHEFTK